MDDDARAALISRLFGVLTAKFEDGAEVAGRAQRVRHSHETAEAAHRLIDLAEEATTVAQATLALSTAQFKS